TTDLNFLARISYAVGKYAAYISNEDPGAQNHPARLNWAFKAFQDPLVMARSVVGAVCRDDNVVADLAAVTDQNLQTATETAANTMMLTSNSYAALIAVATNPGFLLRVQLAVVKFAMYILDEAGSVTNHANRKLWAQTAVVGSMGVANTIAPSLVLDNNVSVNLTAITDAQLQAAVENQIQALFIAT